MQKAILIIVDGVGYDTMVSQCSYLETSVDAGIARRWKMQACLPTLSAPSLKGSNCIAVYYCLIAA